MLAKVLARVFMTAWPSLSTGQQWPAPCAQGPTYSNWSYQPDDPEAWGWHPASYTYMNASLLQRMRQSPASWQVHMRSGQGWLHVQEESIPLPACGCV